MEFITFHFHSNSGLMSRFIEWKTGSNLSHVSIEVRGYHYNAYADTRFYRTKEKGDDVKESYSVAVTKEIADKAERILSNALGSLYDYKAMFGFLFNVNKHSKARAYCSEIANVILELIVPGRVKYKKLISPDAIRIAVIYYLKGIETTKLPEE